MKMDPSQQLTQSRQVINKLDEQILSLLAQRMKCSLEVIEAKKEMGKAVYDPEREAWHLEDLMTLGKEIGVDASFVRLLWAMIYEESRRVQSQ